MKKVMIGNKGVVFPDSISDEELTKQVQRLELNQNLKRPIVVRKRNGTSYQLLNGVRLNNGKR